MTALFEPLTLCSVTLKNRIIISPMCTYSAESDGRATDWHLVHYGRFALGGAAMVMVEATAISPEGRHCYADLGIWADEQIEPLRRIATFIKSQGCVSAIQLQHAGRKASARRAWDGQQPLDDEDVRLRGEQPWQTVAPSAVSYSPKAPVPAEIGDNDLNEILESYVSSTRRALQAGFEVLEIHMAHGYLLHQFLSPISNQRDDRYGGDRDGRMRFPLEVTEAVRAIWPKELPLLVRVSAVDGFEGGWTLEDTVALATALKERGVTSIDCSSGGIDGSATIPRLPRSPGFQVPIAEHVRREVNIPTIAVGLILTAEQAAEVVDQRCADLVAIGREALINPNWPNNAWSRLKPEQAFDQWPVQSGWWLDKREKSLRAR